MGNRPLPALLALVVVTAAHAEMRESSHAGTLKIEGGTARSATLHVACTPDRDGGALGIELIVPEANTRKDFDYDDFEGPDAAAAEKSLSLLTWTGGAAPTSITAAASGWYMPEPPGAFAFGVSQLSHRREAPARLLLAVEGGVAGELEWTQSAFDAQGRKLVATFPVDAAASQRLHDAVVRCLPIDSPKKP